MSLPRIAVDAMGGDEGVRVMVEGAALARRRNDRAPFLLAGDEVAGQRHAQPGVDHARGVVDPLEIAEHPEQRVGGAA